MFPYNILNINELVRFWEVRRTDYFDSGMDDIFILLTFKLLHLPQTN